MFPTILNNTSSLLQSTRKIPANGTQLTHFHTHQHIELMKDLIIGHIHDAIVDDHRDCRVVYTLQAIVVAVIAPCIHPITLPMQRSVFTIIKLIIITQLNLFRL